MWLKSLYCFHFIVFSDNYFGKSFQEALSGKQSYRGSWYKYANDTIPRWPTSTVFWNSFIADSIKSAHTVLTALLKLNPSLQHAFEHVPNISSPQSPCLH